MYFHLSESTLLLSIRLLALTRTYISIVFVYFYHLWTFQCLEVLVLHHNNTLKCIHAIIDGHFKDSATVTLLLKPLGILVLLNWWIVELIYIRLIIEKV